MGPLIVGPIYFAMDLKALKTSLQTAGLYDAIRSVCDGKTECYLVGGAIRDFLLGRELNDFDFCFPDNPTEYARHIADRLGATFFVLDEVRGHSRFVLKDVELTLTCDFAPFRAPSLERDLRKRDFTINAMAVSCCRDDLALIDPLGGQGDLTSGMLKVCSEYSFQEDPLRCLKGVRHAVRLGFEFDSETLRLLIASVPQIDQVASERIRSELARAVASGNPVRAFELLGQTGLHKELFGPASSEAYAAGLTLVRDLGEAIKTLRIGACGQVVEKYLKELCEENVSIEVALLLSAFFYGYRPVALKSVLSALRFSKRTISLVEQLQGLNEGTIESFDQVAKKARSRARWLSGLGQEPIAAAIFLMLVSPGTIQGNLLQTELLIDSYSTSLVNGKLGELVDGSWLTKALGVAEGPEVGHLFSLLHQAEISGEVTTPAEAQQWLLEYQKSIDKDFGETL